MAARRRTLIVDQNQDPKKTFRFRVRKADGTTVPYTLEGSPTIEFYLKASPQAADGTAKYTIANSAIVITDDGTQAADTYSEITVQFAAADIATPGRFWYRIDVIKAAKRETVIEGPLVVRDV